MFSEEAYIYKKEVDWSVLYYGINIPVSIQVAFQQQFNNFLKKGESKEIILQLEDKSYKVKLINQNFDKSKYPTHKDLLQIRYTPQSKIAIKIREIFLDSYRYLKIEKNKLFNHRQPLRMPDNLKEYVILYTTKSENIFLVNTLTCSDIKAIKYDFSSINEEELEFTLNFSKVDLSAKIESRQQIVKIRKLDKSIGENLKLLYEFRCQICGYNFSDKHNTVITEAHHIEYFVTSLNNNADNIVIVCPNHHRIIHKTKPTFDKNNLHFIYPNGFEEIVRLNKHIGI